MYQKESVKEAEAFAADCIADIYFLKGFSVRRNLQEGSLDVEGKKILVKAIGQDQDFLVLSQKELFSKPDGLVLCEVDSSSCSFLGSISYQEFLEEATLSSSPLVLTSIEGKVCSLPEGGAALEKGFLLDELLLPEDIKAA